MAGKSNSSAEKSGSDGQKLSNKSIRIGSVQIVIMVGLLSLKSVPWGDILFAVFASFYICMMSRYAFPTPKIQSAPGDWTFTGKRYIGVYVVVAGILGLLLPLTLIVISFVVGDQMTLRAAAPHLFLLSAQVLSENVTYQKSSNSLPIKAMIAITYNARRLINLHTWTIAAFSGDLSSSVSVFCTVFGRCLAVGNVILWHFNLWCFLLGVFLPFALRTHYAAVLTHAD